MWAARQESLKNLIRRYQLALLLILTAAAGLGGVWSMFWQSGYESSLRLNGLLVEAQAVRGDLYRQIKALDEVADRRPRDDYWQRLYRIDEHFYRMRRFADTPAERDTIARMEAAYGLLLAAMNRVVTQPGDGSEAGSAIDQWSSGDFEAAYSELSAQVAEQRDQLAARMHLWTTLAPWLAWLPLLIGIVVVVWLNRRFVRGFVRPLEQLVADTGALGRGQLSYPLKRRGVAEIQHLADTLNTMAAELEHNRRALVEREREAALGALVPVIAHNIRNPLAGIRANAQMLDRETTQAELEETGADIIDAADRLERWLAALLSYLHPLDLKRTRHELDTIIDGAVAALGGRLVAADIACERRRTSAVIDADAVLLEQALHGLLANALEASPPGSTLRLSTRIDDDRVEFTIDDEGPGMPHVPDPQTRMPVPTTKRRGTGLGIPFAYKIIQAHDGVLTYAAGQPRGTRTCVCLPRADP